MLIITWYNRILFNFLIKKKYLRNPGDSCTLCCCEKMFKLKCSYSFFQGIKHRARKMLFIGVYNMF